MDGRKTQNDVSLARADSSHSRGYVSHLQPESVHAHGARDVHHGMQLQQSQREIHDLPCDALQRHPADLEEDECFLHRVGFAAVVDVRAGDDERLYVDFGQLPHTLG